MKHETRVVVIGRPNVGKSTLVNTISEKRTIVTSDVSGTTRDVIERRINWLDKTFIMIDTGGLVLKESDLLQEHIQEKINEELEKASLILLVVDEKTGITSYDREISKKIRKEKKDVIVVINKVDSFQKWSGEEAFLSLGFKDIVPVSGLTGKGVGDLLDEIAKKIPKKQELEKEAAGRFAFIGKQNVGKSSLSNYFLKSNRSIESNIPGTTIDIIESDFKYKERSLTIIDTAGLKREIKTKKGVEKSSQKKVMGVMDNSDIICFVLDGSKRLTRQDMRIGKEIEEHFIPTIIVVNKCDLLIPKGLSEKEKDRIFRDKKREIRTKLSALFFARIVFVSVKDEFNLDDIPKSIIKTLDDCKRDVTQEKINDFLEKFLIEYPPKSSRRRKTPKISGLKKRSTNPLVFELKVSKKGYLIQDYVKLMAKKLHKSLNIFSRPIRITINKKQ